MATLKSGKTHAEMAAHEEVSDEEALLPAKAQAPEERNLTLSATNFTRMRTEWKPEQREALDRAKDLVDRRIYEAYSGAYQLLHNIYSVVRVPVTSNGIAIKGLPEWEVDEFGSYVEDWSKLTHAKREHFLYQIVTNLFFWEQQAQDAWFESMFAKREWETSFASGYESLPASRTPKPTVDDRNTRAKLASEEDHHFALMQTYYSRRADSIVRTLNAICQRLKDLHLN